jgi:outer membrane immunogenic protein
MEVAMRTFRLTLLALTTGAALTLSEATAWAESPKNGDGRGVVSPTWTGFYVGGAVGYGFGFPEVELPATEGPVTTDFGLRGVQGVVSLGYDVRLGPRWVLGAFADYAFGDIDGQAANIKIIIDNQWAIGGRLGYLSSPTTLWYGTAGYTGADFEVPNLTIARAMKGLFVGAGIEQMLNREGNVSMKLEYRISGYDEFTAGVVSEDFENEVHSVRLGVNWRFGPN